MPNFHSFLRYSRPIRYLSLLTIAQNKGRERLLHASIRSSDRTNRREQSGSGSRWCGKSAIRQTRGLPAGVLLRSAGVPAAARPDSMGWAQQHSLGEMSGEYHAAVRRRQQNADLPCFLVSGSQHASHNTDERDKQCHRTDGLKQGRFPTRQAAAVCTAPDIFCTCTPRTCCRSVRYFSI